VITFLTENGKTEALAALNRLDIARLDEVMAVVTRFMKCVEGGCISYSDIQTVIEAGNQIKGGNTDRGFPMSQSFISSALLQIFNKT
jgi:ribosomal protein S6E (S10)